MIKKGETCNQSNRENSLVLYKSIDTTPSLPLALDLKMSRPEDLLDEIEDKVIFLTRGFCKGTTYRTVKVSTLKKETNVLEFNVTLGVRKFSCF